LLHENCTSVTLIVSRLRRRATAFTTAVVTTLGAIITSVAPVTPVIASITAVSWTVVAVVIILPTSVVITAGTLVAGAIIFVLAVAGTATPAPVPDTTISTATFTLVPFLAQGHRCAAIIAPASTRGVTVCGASVAHSNVFRGAKWHKVGMVVEVFIVALRGGLLVLALLLPLCRVEKLFNALEVRHGVGESL
jgi:hypothetical protein